MHTTYKKNKYTYISESDKAAQVDTFVFGGTVPPPQMPSSSVPTFSRKPKPRHIVKKRGIVPDGLVRAARKVKFGGTSFDRLGI